MGAAHLLCSIPAQAARGKPMFASLPDLGIYEVVRIRSRRGAPLVDMLDVLDGHLQFFGIVPDMRKDHVASWTVSGEVR